MKYSPRLHLERLEERITPDASTPMPMPVSAPSDTTIVATSPATPAPSDPTAVAPTSPASLPVVNSTIPTQAQMLAALNQFLATLPPPPTPPSTGGYYTGLGSTLGGGSLGQ